MIAQWENECISLSALSIARVMIAQWANECISLSVLSMARVMIAQWQNECISLSVLSMGLVMIAQWENEAISLSVLSMARVMIAQWENESISLSVLPVSWLQLPISGGVFRGIFPWLLTFCQPVLSQRGRKWFNLPSVAPHNLWKSRMKAEVKPQACRIVRPRRNAQ